MFHEGSEKQTFSDDARFFRVVGFSRKRAPCWHSLGPLLAAERRAECACWRYGGGKRSNARGGFERRNERIERRERERARAAREQPRAPKISVLSSFLSLSFPFFCPALLENSNAVRGERTPSLSALWKSLPAPRTTAPSSSQPSTGAARRRRRRREQQQKQRRRRKTKHRRRHLGRCPFLLRRRSRRLLCRPLRAAPSGPIAAGVITLGCILSSAEGE